MNRQLFLKRITMDPQVLDGRPSVRGRLAVEHVLELLTNGETFETMAKTYPWLEPEDIQACLVYARELVIQEQANPIHRQPKTLNDLSVKMPTILEQVPYLRLLVLFGSRARSDQDTQSDWDFAFLCDEELRKQYEKGGWADCLTHLLKPLKLRYVFPPFEALVSGNQGDGIPIESGVFCSRSTIWVTAKSMPLI